MPTIEAPLVTPENLTQASLVEIFDDALMDATIDEDGDLFVHESGLRIFVDVHAQADAVKFSAFFRFREGTDQVAKLVFANQVNEGYRTARVRVGMADRLTFDYEVRVKGGTTRRAILYALKWFAEIPPLAIEQYGQDLFT